MTLHRNKKSHSEKTPLAALSDIERGSHFGVLANGSRRFADVLRRLASDQSGQDMIEYAMVAGFVVGITIAATPSVFVAVAELLARVPQVMEPITSL